MEDSLNDKIFQCIDHESTSGWVRAKTWSIGAVGVSPGGSLRFEGERSLNINKCLEVREIDPDELGLP